MPLLTDAQNITTVAGGGAISDFGAGVPALTAAFLSPYAVSLDIHGNLYITTNFGYGHVHKVNRAGVITTIAGCLTTSTYAASGPATTTFLGNPTGLSVDNSGNVYIADQVYDCIREVNDSGMMDVVAGDYIAYRGWFTGDNGPATDAAMNGPYGVALDQIGNVYIADANNQRIRKVDTSGTITTIGGNGISGFSGDGGPATDAQLYDPYAIAVDNLGNTYIADTHNNRIRKINSSGIISTVAGSGSGIGGYGGDGGPATDAYLFYPAGVAVDNSGSIYIADEANNRIRVVNTSGIITTIAGTGVAGFSGDGAAATAATLFQPIGVTVDNYGNVYFADRGNDRVRKISPGCPAPILGPLTGRDSVNIDSVIQLTEILPGGSWSSSDGTIATVSSGFITGLTPGIDTIKYTLLNDCGTVIAEKIIYVLGAGAASGTQNVPKSVPSATVYPNPAGSEIAISSSVKIMTVAVSNVLGQVMCNQTCNSQKVKLNVASLPAGIYYVRINGSEVRKFYKE